MQTQKAFTFYEVLIVLAITAILAALTIPAWQQFFAKTNDDLLRANLTTALATARAEAQARGTVIGFCKNTNWIAGQLIIADTNGDGSVTDEAQILSVQQTQFAHGTLNWRGFPFYRNYLQFLPSGLMANTNGTFWHCHTNKIIWALALSKSGLMKVQYPNRSGAILDSEGKELAC